MSRFRVEHIPSFTEYEIASSQLFNRLQGLGLKNLFLWDARYWYVSHEDWGKIFEDVLLNLPKYTTDKFDCEDFAMLVTARVLEKYKLNTCGIAIGQSPMGYHGFNIFFSNWGFHYLEPQTGDIYSITENSGYKAKIIIMG